MKNEITELVKAIEILGKTGTLDYILSDEGSLNDVVNALASTQQGQANSQIATALDYLLSTDGARLAFIVALNSFLDSTETTEHPLGNIDKDLSWNGWTAFKIDFKNAVDNLIKAIQNVDESLIDASFDDFKVFINDDFAETAIYLGKVLDFTASTQLLVYTENNQEKSIYDELIEMLFGDIFTLEDAKSDKWQANFWTTEFSNLSSVLIKIKDITINENTPDETPLLDAILDGGDINELLEKANLSDADTTEILNAFLSSKLFKDQVHTAINAVHKELINLVDPDYADELENLEEAIEEQQDDVIDVINNAIKLKDITDIEEISLEEHGEALAGILETMQENTYNTEYENSIFESAYNAITDYITDENTTTENQSINAVIDVINDPANQSLIGDSIENYNWAEIINLASQKLQNS